MVVFEDPTWIVLVILVIALLEIVNLVVKLAHSENKCSELEEMLHSRETESDQSPEND